MSKIKYIDQFQPFRTGSEKVQAEFQRRVKLTQDTDGPRCSEINSKVKIGYEPGVGTGLRLHELLWAVEKATTFKIAAVAAKNDEAKARKCWIAHYAWKSKLEKLRAAFLADTKLI